MSLSSEKALLHDQSQEQLLVITEMVDSSIHSYLEPLFATMAKGLHVYTDMNGSDRNAKYR